MATQIPRYAKGNNVTLFDVSGQTVDASGNLTDGTHFDFHLLGVFESFEFAGSVVDENIKPADGFIANYVNLYDDFEVTIGEVLPANNQSVLMAEWASRDYFRCAVRLTSDGVVGSSSDTGMVVVFKRRSINYSIVEGKPGVKLVGVPCGIPAQWGIMSALTI